MNPSNVNDKMSDTFDPRPLVPSINEDNDSLLGVILDEDCNAASVDQAGDNGNGGDAIVAEQEQENQADKAVMIRICTVLLMFELLSVTAPPLLLVDMFSGYLSHMSDAFRLAKKALIEEEAATVPRGGGKLFLWDAGRQQRARTLLPLPRDTTELVDLLLRNIGRKFPPKATTILKTLCDAPGHTATKVELADAVGCKNVRSQGCAESIKWLLKRRLIEKLTGGTGEGQRYRLVPALTPFSGRP